ncbi:MAG: glycine--tRNA ligase subunit beta [Desulfonatronovibrio sp.]
MPDFVLEIGFEEMPARFLEGLTAELKKYFTKCLQRDMVDYKSIDAFSTPRRLSAYVSDISSNQNSREELITGPPVSIAYDQDNNLTKAGQGFAKSQQVELDDLFRHETPKGEYLAVKKTIGGKKTKEILPEICIESIKSLNFPKKMRWADTFTFGRPMRWILCILNKETIDFQISDVKSGQETFGHRVLGPGPLKIRDAQDYFQVLENEGRVVLNPAERMKIIQSQGAELAREAGAEIVDNPGLIKETSNLVEYPNPVLASFDKKYLQLPREVLLTSMETHQKSFGVADSQGNLMSHFITVINNVPEDIALVRKGWERVLKARLEDAMFFWNADRSVTTESRQEKLDRVVFLAPLGSMGSKARRLEKISGFICDELKLNNKKDVQQAALICKSDLVSEMVGEFADLQGIMGGIYAAQEGYTDDAVRAVYEHYLPLGPESSTPQTISGAIVALSDKVDTLTGCFGLGMIPTGAADPYALRRQALGIIRIILEHKLDLSLCKLFSYSGQAYSGVKWKNDLYQTQKDLLKFIAARLKVYWQGKGFDGKIVDAVLNADSDNILMAEKRLKALNKFSKHPDFEPAVLTFKRIDNITRKQGSESGVKLLNEFNRDLLRDKYETELAESIDSLLERWDELLNQSNFEALFDLLHGLRPVIDEFFDNVMVMCEDKNLRQNRLNMLNVLATRLATLADFSALQV